FTEALLDGLNGDAAPAGLEITCANLRSYLQGRVQELTRNVTGGPQLPYCQYGPETLSDKPGAGANGPGGPGPASSVVLVPRSPGPGQRKITLRFVAFQGEVQLFGGRNERLRQPFTVTPGAERSFRLLPGLYRLLSTDGQVLPGIQNMGFFQYSGESN